MDLDLAEDAWRCNLGTFAERVSRGQWKPHRWAAHLAERVQSAVLEGDRRVVVTAPPRHGKSVTLSQWLPAWYLDMYPDRKLLLASYAAKLATSWSERVRDTFLLSSETWTRVNPGHSRSDDWQTTDGGGMQSVGVDSGVTGFGGDVIVIDDPHKDWAEVQSAANRQHVIDWFNGTLYHRLEPGGSIILIQTRWHKNDLAGYLLEEHGDDWEEIRFPALAEDDDAIGREVGEALCPERYSAKRLELIRDQGVGAQVFAGLFQQRPSPREGNIIKRDWIQYYTEVPDGVRQFQSWDLNFGDATTAGSYNVGQVWGVRGSQLYLLDQVRDRWEYTTTKRKLVGLSVRWPNSTEKLVEKKAAGAPLISDLRNTVSGLVPITPTGSKQTRLEAVAPLFEANNVFFPHPTIAPWVLELVEELVSFPSSEHDDQVDALSQALNRCRHGGSSGLRLNLDVGVGTPAWRLH